MKRLSFLLALLLFPVMLFALSYSIDSYKIDLDVEETGLIHVTEEIAVHFHEQAHGIYRDIQTTFDNPNGNEFDPIHSFVTNFQSSSVYKESKEDGYRRYQFGSKDAYAKEYETYSFSYDYRLDYDRYPDYDELYYNLISPAWDCEIASVSWAVHLPKATSRNSIFVTGGSYGSTDKELYALSKNGTLVQGTDKNLKPLEALTIRVEMPEGYWTDMTPPEDPSEKTTKIAGYISILALIVTVALWSVYGDDEPLQAEKRSTPPEGLSPMEVGYLQDSALSTDKEILSMIFYWAGKGYLEIEESKKTQNKKEVNEYTLIKKKELEDGVPSYEKKLFELLFTKDSVTTEDIVASGFANKVTTDVIPALTKAYSKGEKRMKSKKSLIVQGLLLALWFGMAIVNGILLSQKLPGLLSLTFSIIYVFHFLGIFIIFGLWSDQGQVWTQKRKVWLVVTAALLTLAAYSIALFVSHSALLDMALMAKSFAVVSLTQTIGIAVACFADLRSDEGKRILEECIGYRKFLLSTPYTKIADLEKEHPGFFNEAMPYALAMGIGKEWSEKAKRIEGILEPNWFRGEPHYPYYLYYYTVFHSYRTTYNSSVMHVPTTAGGSGYHSSGFAGGGFSGGGGGAW